MTNQLTSLEALQLTLEELGWEGHQGFNPKLKIWSPTPRAKLEPLVSDAHSVKVLVPLDTQAPDFEHLLHTAIAEFADFSAANVLEEFATSKLRIKRNLDKFVVSTDGPAVRNGVIDWRIGESLVTGLSEILTSGARAAHQNLRWYSGASRVIADNYLDSCLMGQTEVGSYVVKAFVPAKAKVPVSNSKKAKKQSQMTARDVSETVLASVEATKEVLEEYRKNGDSEAFEWAATQGVSVEMLSGVQNLINAEETELSVDFIRLETDKPEHEPYRKSVVFDPTLREAVEVGVSTLRMQPQPTDLRVSGEVIGLMRQWDEPDSRRIKMRGISPEGRSRVYTVHLDQADYDRAMQAHKHQVLFEVYGLAEKGRFVEVKTARVTNAPVSGERDERRTQRNGKAPGQLDLLSVHEE